MHARNVPRRCLLLLPMMLLAGCGMARSLPGGSVTVLNHLGVVVEQGANQQIATALDVVFVYDTQAEAVLPRTGPEWFARKAVDQNSLGSAIDVVPLQLPPATVMAEVALPPRHRQAVAVYAYVDYLAAAGQARLSLGAYRNAVIRLTPDHAVIDPH